MPPKEEKKTPSLRDQPGLRYVGTAKRDREDLKDDVDQHLLHESKKFRTNVSLQTLIYASPAFNFFDRTWRYMLINHMRG